MPLTATLRDKVERLAGTVGTARREGGAGRVGRVLVREVVGSARRAGGYAAEAVVDRRFGMDTRGIVKNDAVVRDRSAGGDGCYYQATPLRAFRRVVRASGVDPARTTFVDLGAGRGRALMFAADLGFRSVIGVELDPDLSAGARRNAAAGRGSRAGRPAIEVRTGDAAAVDVPPGDLFVFLFNPFGPQTLQRVLDRLGEAQRVSPRRVTLAYMNPVHADVVAARPAFRLVARGRSWVVHRWDAVASRP